MKALTYILFFLLFIIFSSCKDDKEESPAEGLSITIYNSIDASHINYPDQDSVLVYGVVKSSSTILKLQYYRVDGGVESLIEEITSLGVSEYAFSKKIYVSPSTSAVRVRCFDSANKNAFADYNISVSLASWTSSLGAAFDGAQGGGVSATGGRLGQVLYVTNLFDNTAPGSLRWAISQTGPRIIVFKTSGTIKLGSALEILNGDVTIAGQTAPGDGICLRDYPVRIKANNVIIQFMRFRMGDAAAVQDDALGAIGFENIMIDHCSMSWSTDECGSFYNNKNFTLQWCILSESLRISVHEKGTHGYGGIWGGQNASFHHNLLADHDSRNPRFDHDGVSNIRGPIDFVNNVIFNWGGNSSYGGENRQINIVNNYYKSGPASKVKDRIFNPSGTTVKSGSDYLNPYGKYYIYGNYVDSYTTATEDNWGIGVQMPNLTTIQAEADKAFFKVQSPFVVTSVSAQTAENAYTSVITNAGASLKRDAVDSRIISQVVNGDNLNIIGQKGSTGGLIDTQTDVGGWPTLSRILAPSDFDSDGMPDSWEDAMGLNKYNASDRNSNVLNSNKTNIEFYLNYLVSHLY